MKYLLLIFLLSSCHNAKDLKQEEKIPYNFKYGAPVVFVSEFYGECFGRIIEKLQNNYLVRAYCNSGHVSHKGNFSLSKNYVTSISDVDYEKMRKEWVNTDE